MKKVFMLIMVISLCAAAALAGPVDQELPETTPAQVRRSARQMIEQGFNAEAVVNMTRQMLATRFSEQQVLQVHAMLMDVRRQGLPTEPMMNKAYEGLAKQVKSEAVVKAMEQVQSRYEFATRQARTLTGDSARANQMASILAESLAAGMNNEDAERIMQALRERTRNMAQAHSEELATQTFMTTRMMARIGMQSKSVGDSICSALQQGYSAQQMHTMRNTVMASSRHSYSEGSSGDSANSGAHGSPQGMGGQGGDSGGGMGGGSGGHK